VIYGQILGGFAMSVAIPLRDDFDGPGFRVLAKDPRHPAHLRRLPALAEIYDSGSRGNAARIVGDMKPDRQTRTVA